MSLLTVFFAGPTPGNPAPCCTVAVISAAAALAAANQRSPWLDEWMPMQSAMVTVLPLGLDGLGLPVVTVPLLGQYGIGLLVGHGALLELMHAVDD